MEFLRERVTAFLDLSAARLTREVHELGYAGAYTAAKRFLAAIRPENRPKPYEVHFETPPGNQAQADFATLRGGLYRQPSPVESSSCSA